MNDLNETQSPDVFTRKWLLMVMLCLIPLFFLFVFLGYPGNGRAAVICAGVLATAVKAKWNLRENSWFWATVAILIAIHIPFVLFIPWTTASYPGIALLPVAVVDYAFVYGCIKLTEKIMSRS
jgi:hypothetical protein